MFVAQAAPGPAESTIVLVTPERILDTRNGNDIGLPGPFVSPVGQKLQVTGSIPTATGTKVVVPTGVLLNVTAVGATANGFISIRPGDATGTPSTSSLNVTAGITVPNSVQASMPTAGANAGKIDISWDALGTAGPTTDILIDVVGYLTPTTTPAAMTFIGDYNFSATTTIGTSNPPPAPAGYTTTNNLDAGRYFVTGDVTVKNATVSTNDSLRRTYVNGAPQDSLSIATVPAAGWGNLAISNTIVLNDSTVGVVVDFRCVGASPGFLYFFGNMTIYKVG